MESPLRSNIWKIALSDVFYSFGIIGSIYILYFNDYLGYNSQSIGLYEAITSITIIATELFTGVIADRIGRKISVLLSNSCFFLFAILLGSAGWIPGGFYTILIFCGVLNGLEFSFRSGAKSALLYDTLLLLHREEEILKITGRIQALTIISNALGMILGGLLYPFIPILPYWIWAVFILIASIILANVQEPEIKKTTYQSIWKNLNTGVRYIFQTKILLWLVVFGLFADVFAESYWDIYSQKHLEILGTPFVGVFIAIITAVCAIASYYLDKIEQRLGQRWMLYGIVGMQTLLFLGFAWVSRWYLLFFLLILFKTNRNFTWLVTEAYENQLIPSEHRAATLSAASFLRNGLFGGAILIYIVGWLIEHVTISVLFTILAGIIFLANGILLVGRDLYKKLKKFPLLTRKHRESFA